MPAGKGGERAIDCRTVGPVLAVPCVVLSPADEIQQASAGYKIMHEMGARSDPRLVAVIEAEIGDALDRDKPAIGDTAGEHRCLVAEQPSLNCRMDAIGADQQVDRNTRAIVESGLDAVSLVGEAGESVAEM